MKQGAQWAKISAMCYINVSIDKAVEEVSKELKASGDVWADGLKPSELDSLKESMKRDRLTKRSAGRVAALFQENAQSGGGSLPIAAYFNQNSPGTSAPPDGTPPYSQALIHRPFAFWGIWEAMWPPSLFSTIGQSSHISETLHDIPI